MKYYQLHHDSDEKNVGAYEQITGLTVPFTKEKMDAFLNMQLCREDYMDPLPDLSQFELLHRAVLTDVLSFSHLSMNEGFLCNGKVKSVLEEMHQPMGKFFPARVTRDETVYEYFFYYLIEEREAVSFTDSEFHITNFMNVIKDGPVSVESCDDFHRKNYEIQLTRPGRLLSLTRVGLNSDVPVIRLPGDSLIHVSEQVKERLAGISGITFRESSLNFYRK